MITLQVARCPRAKDPEAQPAKFLLRDGTVKGQVRTSTVQPHQSKRDWLRSRMMSWDLSGATSRAAAQDSY